MKMNQDEIKGILPHREPMLLVTSVEELSPGENIRAAFFASPEMDIFRGHFPEEPILPGVYSIECMAQAVDILLMSTVRYAGKTPLLLGVDKVSFRKKILPGDILEIRANIISEQKEKAIVTCAAEIYVHQERAANGDITIAMR
jgi:3-hydroxyacyl-[acyl-carrier-protein] dehydratase